MSFQVILILYGGMKGELSVCLIWEQATRTSRTQSEPRWEFEIGGQLPAPAVLPPRIESTEQSMHIYSQRCTVMNQPIQCQYDHMVRITSNSKKQLHIPIQYTAVEHVLKIKVIIWQIPIPAALLTGNPSTDAFLYINPLKTKRRLLYLNTQSVPRCKHFSSGL
jgi:hypothetical protein